MTIVNTFLDILFGLCLILAFVLALQLLNILWPGSIPFARKSGTAVHNFIGKNQIMYYDS